MDVDRKEEEVLRDIDLGEDGRIAEKATHAAVGRLGEPAERKKPAEKVGGVVINRTAEEVFEDDLHDEKHKQRRKHAPPHSKNRTFVLLLEIALDKLLE